MSYDAAIYARLLDGKPSRLSVEDHAGDLATIALRLACRTREVAALLREASMSIRCLRDRQHGGVERLAAVLAEAEDAAEVQASYVRDLISRLG